MPKLAQTLILREKEQFRGGSHFTSHIWQHEHLGDAQIGGLNMQNVTGMVPDFITKVLEQLK